MKIHSVLPASIIAVTVVVTIGCAQQVEVMARPGATRVTGAQVPAPAEARVIAPEIRSRCSLPEDGTLEQIARCFTTGPMKGRTLRLRGPADAVRDALVRFGMPATSVTTTSRDEPARQTRGEVDIDLEAAR